MAIELMAIGDSIYNGVRSLTINADLAAHSVPAQVAGAFRWNFVSPDYPRPMLADLEAVFRDPAAGTLDLLRDVASNAHAWLADKSWSRQPMFHNISIAQQVVNDIGTANYADSLATAERIATLGAAMALTDLPTLYQALNTCFILNPGRVANDKRTAVDILSEAKPKRLLVNMGINDGLWDLLFMANPTNYQAMLNLGDMAKLAAALQAKCPDIEHFYINLFPKPSSIGNLMSRADDDAPQNGYFEHYIGRLLGNGGIPAATMREIDTWVNATLNPGICDAFAPLGARAHFVDLYAMSGSYDRKNGIASKSVIVNNGGTPIMLDNLPLEVVLLIGGLLHGGQFGLDNLHPTIPGYGLIAQAVCDTIAAAEGLAPVVINMQACYAADTLLHSLPASIGLADFALELVSSFIPGA